MEIIMMSAMVDRQGGVSHVAWSGSLHAGILYLLIHSRSTTPTYISSSTQHLQFIVTFDRFVRTFLRVELLYVSTIVVPRTVSW